VCLDIDSTKYELYYLRAIAYFRAGNFNDCIIDCNKAIYNNISLASTCLLRGKCYKKLNQKK